jgi:hypothetical protein
MAIGDGDHGIAAQCAGLAGALNGNSAGETETMWHETWYTWLCYLTLACLVLWFIADLSHHNGR